MKVFTFSSKRILIKSVIITSRNSGQNLMYLLTKLQFDYIAKRSLIEFVLTRIWELTKTHKHTKDGVENFFISNSAYTLHQCDVRIWHFPKNTMLYDARLPWWLVPSHQLCVRVRYLGHKHHKNTLHKFVKNVFNK